MPLSMPTAAPVPPIAAVQACSAREIALATEGGDGEFTGMSHNGVYLVMRNVGRRACSVPGLPAVAMRGADGRRLPIARRAPVGMHPGPGVRPVTIPAGGRVATGVRWVSGPVYARNRRLDVRSVSITVGGRQVSAPLRATIFADGAAPASFDQPVLERYPSR